MANLFIVTLMGDLLLRANYEQEVLGSFQRSVFLLIHVESTEHLSYMFVLSLFLDKLTKTAQRIVIKYMYIASFHVQ